MSFLIPVDFACSRFAFWCTHLTSFTNNFACTADIIAVSDIGCNYTDCLYLSSVHFIVVGFSFMEIGVMYTYSVNFSIIP